MACHVSVSGWRNKYIITDCVTAKPGMVDALEGLVAARGFSEVSVITTPNATWVPKFAVAHSEITTYMDGRWGLHEYSRWPQAFSRELWYIHCIPAHPRPLGPGPVCFRTLQRSDWRADDCGITNVGFLEIILQVELLSEARIAISQYERVDKKGSAWATTGDFLAVSLRHVSDRLRTVPAAPSIVICLAAHVQRLTLELYGMVEWLSVVMDRVRTSRDHRTDVLDVLGAHTSNPTEAQRLHWIGMPVWLEREISERVDVYQIVEAADVPSDFSRIPCVPRLVLAKRDVSGALNMPGEWERAMAAVVSRQLCAQDLPSLLDEEARGTLPPAKRLREGAAFLGEYSSSVGPVNPTFVVKNRRDIRTLGHILPPAPPVSTSQSAEHQSRRAKARAAKRAISGLSQTGSSGALSSTPVPFKLEPSRQFYPSHNVIVDDLWATAMAQASGCPQPRASVKFFFPPPWLLDSLVGFETSDRKRARYVHHWLSIRKFCRTRLFDGAVQGRPLTVAEWRHAVWGDYEVDEAAEAGPSTTTGRGKYRHELRIALRRLFGKVASLPSYRVEAEPVFGTTVVTQRTAAEDRSLLQRVVYDVHETNWRCELLSLDALMLESNDWTIVARWAREYLVSSVWGDGTSGIDITPAEDAVPVSPWRLPPHPEWEACRPHHRAFVEILGAWANCPPVVRGAARTLETCDAEEYMRILRAAVEFYVQTFVATFERLPVPPVSLPTDSEG